MSLYDLGADMVYRRCVYRNDTSTVSRMSATLLRGRATVFLQHSEGGEQIPQQLQA